MPSTTTEALAVAGTTLRVEQRGDGPPLLLVHGGGEDAAMLSGQAEALAVAGYRVITYDRRGTGGSGREAWPGNGADQHADDAAALLTALDATPATVLGVSSGGVVALALAARHPAVVAGIVAWEPPGCYPTPPPPTPRSWRRHRLTYATTLPTMSAPRRSCSPSSSASR